MSNRYAEPLQQVDRTYVLWRGDKLSYFAGCDYLRLSSHPAIAKEIRKALANFGLNVSASRKTTGNHHVYGELESAIRNYFRVASAVLSSSGYFTNIIAAQGLRGSIQHVLLDECAHGSLRDAASFLGCPVTEFAHRDPAALKKQLAAPKFASQPRQGIAVLTDGMFSHDGSVAPLREYRAVLGPRGLIWVDDAHAGGILGKRGGGSVDLAGIDRSNVVQTITFSKAFGTYGGAVLCDDQTAKAIIERSGAVGGNTPIPLPLASATLVALKLCDAKQRAKLSSNIRKFWEQAGLPLPQQPAPIIPVVPPDAALLRRRLIAAGIYPPLIQYPGGPKEGYFRFAISSEHSRDQIQALAGVLARLLEPRASTSARGAAALFPSLDL